MTMTGPELASFIIGLLAAVLIAVYVMPQCIKTIKTKDTTSISLVMFILGALGSFCFVLSFMIAGIINKGAKIYTWLPGMVGNIFSSSSSIIVLVYKIRNIQWAKKFGLTETQIPSHFNEIKLTLKKQREARKAEKLAEKEATKEAIKPTPVPTKDEEGKIE